MSDIPVIDDNNRGASMARAFVDKCVRLTTFGAVWGLANMIVVNFIFDRAYHEDPFPVLQLINTVL